MNTHDLWYRHDDFIPVVGHRGICARYPENTLVSFQAAIECGVDLIEFDINVTKDGELVVIHNNTVDATSDHTGKTRDYTLDELKTFDFGVKFPEKFSGERIPTLRELLELVKRKSDDLLLNVEIKDMEHSTVDKTLVMLDEFGLRERSVIACFDAEIIRYTKTAYPDMRTQGFPGRYMKNFTEDTYDVMFGMGIPISWKDCTPERIRADVEFAKKRGILTWLFIADTPDAVKSCIEYGCDNITGNDPVIALETLRALGLHG